MKLSYYVVRGLHKVFKLNAVKNTQLDKTARLCYDIQIIDSSIGRYSYVGEHSCILATEIGNFCSIADGCIIGGPAHDYRLVSTSPVFTAGRNIFNRNFASHDIVDYKKTVIGNDVWIGSHCLIKAGITIGDGAVIGMGAVVTKDIGAYEIWGGNPARKLKKRFDDEICEQLVKTRWWNLQDRELERHAKQANDVSMFIASADCGRRKESNT